MIDTVEVYNSSGVYKIFNILDGHFYIGSSQTIKIRIDEHLRDLRANRHHSVYLQRAWNKYGENSFGVYVLEECETDLLLHREQFYIDTLCPEYNMTRNAARPMLGRKHTEESKKKMGNTRRGRKLSKSHSLNLKKSLQKLSKSSSWRTKVKDGVSTWWKNNKQEILESRKKKPISDAGKDKISKHMKERWKSDRDSLINCRKNSTKKIVYNKEDVLRIRDMRFNKKISISEICRIENKSINSIRRVLYYNWNWIYDD